VACTNDLKASPCRANVSLHRMRYAHTVNREMFVTNPTVFVIEGYCPGGDMFGGGGNCPDTVSQVVSNSSCLLRFSLYLLYIRCAISLFFD